MRAFLLLGLLAGLAIASGSPLVGGTFGSDSVNACINLGRHWTKAALSTTPGVETAAFCTSQACGAGRIMMGVPTGVHPKICNRGCPSGPHKTSSAFYGCRGEGDCGCDCAEEMMRVEVAGSGAAVSSGRHGTVAPTPLGYDAFTEASNKDKCFMNVCTCDSGHSHAACNTLGVANTCKGQQVERLFARGMIGARMGRGRRPPRRLEGLRPQAPPPAGGDAARLRHLQRDARGHLRQSRLRALPLAVREVACGRACGRADTAPRGVPRAAAWFAGQEEERARRRGAAVARRRQGLGGDRVRRDPPAVAGGSLLDDLERRGRGSRCTV